MQNTEARASSDPFAGLLLNDEARGVLRKQAQTGERTVATSIALWLAAPWRQAPVC